MYIGIFKLLKRRQIIQPFNGIITFALSTGLDDLFFVCGDRYAYGNHTEIRIFNSTTEYAKIMRRIESVMKLFRRCLKPTVVSQPLDAAVENVPATPVTETVAA